LGIRADYNWHDTQKLVFYDDATFETIDANYAIKFYDDFLGAYLRKYTANENTTALWNTVETSLNTAIALSADVSNGVAAIIVDSDDNSEIGVLYFGDNECFDLDQGTIFETRLTFSTLPTTGTETVQAVWGMAGSHNATLDSVDCNAWFRLESSAQTTLLWETDDNVTNDDDNATGKVLVANTYNIYRIDFTDKKAVQFFVDGDLVGTASMNGLTAAIGNVQPYFNVSKVKSSGNTGTGTMLIDYVKIWQNRS